MEQRFRSLTETMIAKQTQIESLQTEKHSLESRVERVQKKYDELQTVSAACSKQMPDGTSSGATSIHIAMSAERAEREMEDVRKRNLPAFMRESHNDTQVTRSVKRAVNTLDVLGAKVGIFLRHYPLARILFLLYIMLLHFWVLLVLMTYEPEIHSDLDSLLALQNPNRPNPVARAPTQPSLGARIAQPSQRVANTQGIGRLP